MQHDRLSLAVDLKMNLPIVVRDTVWRDIKSSDRSFVEAVRQCIDKISQRKFDFGLRVKKLKGVSRLVWEARIDRASRLLFTYRQSQDINGQNQKLIAVEAVCIDHDDVSRRAKSIDLDWWDGEETKVLGSLDQEFKMLNAEEQQEIEHLWETEEVEIQAGLADELLGNTKWLIIESKIITSDQEWQVAIESGEDLRLRLTPDESKVIDTYGNILVSGSAGTGKTTVGLYRLARTLQMNPAAICLYVAYNPILVKESEEQFKQLWGNSYENLPLKPNFLTIRDLCLKITKDSGKEFDRHLIGYPQFYQRYIKKPESREYSPFLIWDEIRSVIKGSSLEKQSQFCLLTEKEYENLGKKRSGIIQQRDRHDVYKLAQWYQQYLDREQLADEIDLTRAALQITKTENHNPYTLVVCDEVQDFTEIQLEFLIGLMAQRGEILCAGDINQMISPSGFRWGDLTTRLHAKNSKWTKENLSTNFRSTGKLVSLAIKILNLKFKLLAESQSPEEVSQNITGELARLVDTSKDNLKQINLGAADAILVRTEKRKQELNKTLETALIFTIEESKGLEFDTVYLIDFLENSKSLWADALNYSKKLKEQQKPEMRLEFNLLYVAITRARRLLNICETERSDLWKRSELLESLIPMSVEEAFNQAQSIDPQDWYKRAIYYRDARLFAQALECATKSGDEIFRQEIEIELLLIDRKYDKVAQLLLEAKKYVEAAEIFEKISNWQQASEAWDLAENNLRKSECQIKYFIENGEGQEATKVLVSIGRYKEAAEIFEKLELWQQASEAWDLAENNLRKSECQVKYFIENNKNQEAAEVLVSIKRYKEAAEIFEKIANWEDAAQSWKKAGNRFKSSKCEAKSLKVNSTLEDYSNQIIKNNSHQNQIQEITTGLFLRNDFDASVEILEQINCDRFDLQEIIDVLVKIHGSGFNDSGIIKDIAIKNETPLLEYCTNLLSSWLKNVPRNFKKSNDKILCVPVECNTFELLPTYRLSTSKFKQLNPDFTQEIEAGANLIMELVYTKEDCEIFTMTHLNI